MITTALIIMFIVSIGTIIFGFADNEPGGIVAGMLGGFLSILIYALYTTETCSFFN